MLRFTAPPRPATTSHQSLMLPGDTILPMDLIAEILTRLPVKSILRFMCVCKSWNALISDPQFVKKQYRTSSAADPTRHHVIVALLQSHVNLMDYSLPSLLLSSSSPPTSSQLNLPFDRSLINPFFTSFVGECHGMLCLTISRTSLILWNPSTRKFKNLPSLKWPNNAWMDCGFGYDHLSESYKVVAVFSHQNSSDAYETDAMVHTLGTDSWRRLIQKFPASIPMDRFGRFVSGTLNWLCVYNDDSSSLGSFPAIVSLDLGTETYQQLLLPDCIADVQFRLAIDVLKGCLCILHRHTMRAANVWVLKDYGNKESWTKLLSVPCMEQYPDIHLSVPGVIWISDEDDEILFQDRPCLAVYNSKSGTSKFHEIQKHGGIFAMVHVESLISPCF